MAEGTRSHGIMKQSVRIQRLMDWKVEECFRVIRSERSSDFRSHGGASSKWNITAVNLNTTVDGRVHSEVADDGRVHSEVADELLESSDSDFPNTTSNSVGEPELDENPKSLFSTNCRENPIFDLQCSRSSATSETVLGGPKFEDERHKVVLDESLVPNVEVRPLCALNVFDDMPKKDHGQNDGLSDNSLWLSTERGIPFRFHGYIKNFKVENECGNLENEWKELNLIAEFLAFATVVVTATCLAFGADFKSRDCQSPAVMSEGTTNIIRSWDEVATSFKGGHSETIRNSMVEHQKFVEKKIDSLRPLVLEVHNQQYRVQPVNSSNSDQNHGPYHGSNRQLSTKVASIEFPKFAGADCKRWLFRCEQFFEVEEPPAESKIGVAATLLVGQALQWHRVFMLTQAGWRINRWEDYVVAVTERYGNFMHDDTSPLDHLAMDSRFLEQKDRFNEFRDNGGEGKLRLFDERPMWWNPSSNINAIKALEGASQVTREEPLTMHSKSISLVFPEFCTNEFQFKSKSCDAHMMPEVYGRTRFSKDFRNEGKLQRQTGSAKLYLQPSLFGDTNEASCYFDDHCGIVTRLEQSFFHDDLHRLLERFDSKLNETSIMKGKQIRRTWITTATAFKGGTKSSCTCNKISFKIPELSWYYKEKGRFSQSRDKGIGVELQRFEEKPEISGDPLRFWADYDGTRKFSEMRDECSGFDKNGVEFTSEKPPPSFSQFAISDPSFDGTFKLPEVVHQKGGILGSRNERLILSKVILVIKEMGGRNKEQDNGSDESPQRVNSSFSVIVLLRTPSHEHHCEIFNKTNLNDEFRMTNIRRVVSAFVRIESGLSNVKEVPKSWVELFTGFKGGTMRATGRFSTFLISNQSTLHSKLSKRTNFAIYHVLLLKQRGWRSSACCEVADTCNQ